MIYIYVTKNTDDAREKVLRRHFGHSVEIMRRSGGKPYIKGGFISISHSADTLFVAIADCEIGFDAENMRDIKNRDRVSLRFLGKMAASDEDFLREWVRAESFVKFTGEGLSGMPVDWASAKIWQESFQCRGFFCSISAAKHDEYKIIEVEV